ncbi:MAG: hypothetical protein QXZ44_02875 [Ferroplasma sp.]
MLRNSITFINIKSLQNNKKNKYTVPACIHRTERLKLGIADRQDKIAETGIAYMLAVLEMACFDILKRSGIKEMAWL